MNKNRLFKIIRLIILGIIISCVFASYNLKSNGMYEERTYETPGVACTDHKNCIVYKGHWSMSDLLNVNSNTTVHIKANLDQNLDVYHYKGVLCVMHYNNDNPTDLSKTRYIMKIDNNNVELKIISVENGLGSGTVGHIVSINDFNYAYKMAYILTYSNSYAINFEQAKVRNKGGHKWSNAQYALWSSIINEPNKKETFSREFFVGLSNKISKGYTQNFLKRLGTSEHNFDDHSDKYPQTKTEYNTLKTNATNINSQATTYMNERSNYAEPEFLATDVKAQTANVAGPFKVKFQRNSAAEIYVNEFKLYDKNGAEINGNDWGIGTFSNGVYTNTGNIASETDFYIYARNGVENIGRLMICGGVLNVKAEVAIMSSDYGVQNQMFSGYATRYIQRVYKEININVECRGNLTITKVDASNNGVISNIGFTVKNESTGRYITSTSGAEGSDAVTFYTDSNGQISITRIPIGNGIRRYTIKEVDSKNPLYKTTGGETYVDAIVGGTATITVKNEKAYSLSINKKDSKTKQTLTAKFYIQYQDGTWLTSNSGYQNGESSIEVVGSLKISGIKRGKYHIWEYQTPTGYDITQQDGYGADSSHPTWVECGTYNVGVNDSGNEDTNVVAITVNRENKKWVRNVTGFVWQENPNGKKNDFNNDDFNNVFGEGDDKLSGINVEFVKKDGTLIKATTTGDDGSYSFTFSKEVLYWDLRNYMVRFTYDNGTYSTVRADLAVENKTASRALESHDWGSDSTAEGSGTATTIPNANTLEESIAKYYNESNYTIETLNLGLIKKVNEEFSIIENLDYVELKKGGYTFKYEYGKTAVIQDTARKDNIYDRVALQNSSRSFTQKLYPSDIAYNNTPSENKFEVYVNYNIVITNTMTINIADLYEEIGLNITSLTNKFKPELYEISDGNWQPDGEGKARYKNSIDQIEPGKNRTIQIKFKVRETALQQIIQDSKSNPDIYKDCTTTAIAAGYHNFKRNDYSWNYKPENGYLEEHEHKTRGETRESGALTLKLTLAKQRTISGNVFEDTQTSESKANKTRVGNGEYDDGENKITGVEVSLINKSENNKELKDETVSQLYSTEGNYLKQEGGIWKFTPQPGTVYVNMDKKKGEIGEYKLEGVIPGKYYLRFTYYNGSKIIGNEEKNISIMDYKSTILTEDVANSSEEDWYLNVIGKNHSIATDKYYIDKGGTTSDIIEKRTMSKKEINYSSKEEFNTGKIQAFSEAMDINFEYLKDSKAEVPNADGFTDTYFQTNCTGMNFGIIERPHLDIQLEKTIKNVKLTLSNGTNLINGNPETKDVSDYLTGISNNYAKIETDTTNLYGSTLTVAYKLVVKNKSEIDYATEDYYRFGIKGDAEPVGTAVTKIVDYLPSDQCKYEEATGIDVSNNDYTNNDGYTKENYYANGVIDSNKKYKDRIFNTAETEIKPEAAKNRISETEYTVTVNKLLPSTNTEKNLGWISYSEIVGIKNKTYTTQYVSTMGSYKVGDAGTSEKDNADATITASSPMGKNKSYTVYIIAAGALAVMAGGVIVIKKFVL